MIFNLFSKLISKESSRVGISLNYGLTILIKKIKDIHYLLQSFCHVSLSQSVHIISAYFRKRFAFESQYGLNRSLQNSQCKNFNIIWFHFALNVSRVITFYTKYKRIFAIKGFMKLCHAKCGKKITLLPSIFLYCKFAYFFVFFCSKQILSSKLALLRYMFNILFHC